ncbi:MAG: HNH endonuclease signature motif containing protein, partial [Burkholderiales bacterium]
MSHSVGNNGHSANHSKMWCPGLDSNQHGLAAKGFSYRYGFRHPDRETGFAVWTLSSPCHRFRCFRRRLSSLYTFLDTMKLHKYTIDELKAAIGSSVSIRQVLQKLGIKAEGGNYKVFHTAVRHFGLNTSHFTGMNLSGRTLPLRRKALAEYLTKNSGIQSFKLKRYLLEQKILQAMCSECGLASWRGKPIPLELDHRNGDSRDNELGNLRLLCPNCHALTPTYRGKNR